MPNVDLLHTCIFFLDEYTFPRAERSLHHVAARLGGTYSYMPSARSYNVAGFSSSWMNATSFLHSRLFPTLWQSHSFVSGAVAFSLLLFFSAHLSLFLYFQFSMFSFVMRWRWKLDREKDVASFIEFAYWLEGRGFIRPQVTSPDWECKLPVSMYPFRLRRFRADS